MILLTRILPESARWLITQGRKKDAIKEIQRAAKVNKRNVSKDLLEKVIKLFGFNQNQRKYNTEAHARKNVIV